MRFSVTFALIACSLFVPGCTGDPLVDHSGSSSDSLTCTTTGCAVIGPASGSGDATTVTQIDGAGHVWFTGGAWHVPVAVPAGKTLASYAVDVLDNGPVNGNPSIPVVVKLRASTDNGATWAVIASNQSCGCGTEQAWSTTVNYKPPTGALVELAFSSSVTAATAMVGAASSTAVTVAVLELPAAAWRVVRSSAGYPVLSSDGVWAFDPALVNEIATPLTIPAGATITSLNVHINRNNQIHTLAGDFAVRINRRTFGTLSTASSIATLGTSIGTTWTSSDVIQSTGAVPVGSDAVWLSVTTENFLGLGDPSPLLDNAEVIYSM